MTNELLNEGITLSRNIKRMSEEKDHLEFIRDLISGGEYRCSIYITPVSGKNYSTNISANTAIAVIDSDIAMLNERIKKASEDFAEL